MRRFGFHIKALGVRRLHDSAAVALTAAVIFPKHWHSSFGLSSGIGKRMAVELPSKANEKSFDLQQEKPRYVDTQEAARGRFFRGGNFLPVRRQQVA
jgi:hypothetical protein